MKIKSILERNPIIPAIKDNITLEKALNSNSEIVFIILANIVNIKEYCDKLREKNKLDKLAIDNYLSDLKNFEGNAQALRIVTKLHNFFGNHGMDLTVGTLNTIIKYTRNSKESDNQETKQIVDKKIGYFLSEQDIFNEGKLKYQVSYRFNDRNLNEQKIDEKNNDIVKSANKSKTLLEQISRKDNNSINYLINDMGGDRPMMIAMLCLMVILIGFIFEKFCKILLFL